MYREPKLSKAQIKLGRRQKINRQPMMKINETLKGEEFLKSARRCLRFKQKSSRSKDTSQSRYRCLFADCAHQMHADENAAINIGKKWVRERIA